MTVILILRQFGHIEGEVLLGAHNFHFSAKHFEPGEVKHCRVSDAFTGQSHSVAIKHWTRGLDQNGGVFRRV